MAQMSERSKPQHYRIVGKKSRIVYATAPYSRVLQELKRLQPKHQEALTIEPIQLPTEEP